MKALFLFFIFLLVSLTNAYALPTFEGVCQLSGDWCSTRCQIAGGRDGICNKVHLCICRPL
ncbi:uncharacterized protein LOC115631375 [Scaptodrosophila lebanonensis]|uniref:Uncharacterized protein LOC115631375 n=1 Tax=Drosophila lebanonensis TaxID=7225 RepID=A0A6J2U7K8_DROLE|nr:uncharacterized protein LOC115631375 [Scaptodrosophila lebanonensis]